jgi:hypothetical protein
MSVSAGPGDGVANGSARLMNVAEIAEYYDLCRNACLRA